MKSFWFQTLPSTSVFWLYIHTMPLFITNTFHSLSPIWARSEDMWLRPEPVRGLMKCSMVFEVLFLVMWSIFWCSSGTYFAWGWRKVLWEHQIYWRIRKLLKLVNMVVTEMSFSSPYVNEYLIKAGKMKIFGSFWCIVFSCPQTHQAAPVLKHNGDMNELQTYWLNWQYDSSGEGTLLRWLGTRTRSRSRAVVTNSDPVVFCPENLEQPRKEQAETRAVCVLWEYSIWDLKAIMELGIADLVAQSYWNKNAAFNTLCGLEWCQNVINNETDSNALFMN